MIPRAAIFASGTGSNALNLLDFLKGKNLFDPVLLISDQKEAKILTHANDYPDCEFIFFDPKNVSSKKEYELGLVQFLNSRSIDWAFLAGFMRLLGPSFLHYFYDPSLGRNRVVNIHPSLLPRHPGLDAYEKSFEDSYPEGGVTVHFVDEGMDSGEIILQESFAKIKGESLAHFKTRGLKLEHDLYPRALEKITLML